MAWWLRWTARPGSARRGWWPRHCARPGAPARVADLLPVLRERLPDLPTLAHSPAESHNYLLDGLVDLALALAREQPLIIWCDDAQWADEATLAVLGRLARRTPRHAL